MSRRYPIFGLIAVALIACGFVAVPSAAQQPSVVGQWSSVNPLPYFPVHIHLLPTGKVMIWPGDSADNDDPRSWDPATQTVSGLASAGFDVFCSGHTFLADGRLFVAGGHGPENDVGVPDAGIYNPATNTWTRLPDMNAPRWYPTVTALANGDALVASGTIDRTLGRNTLPQVFQISTGSWRNLTNAQLLMDEYPMLLLAPNGRVFNAGPTPTTRYLDTSGAGAWSFVAERVGGDRNSGSAVMYAPGKVIVIGGRDPPINTAEVIDLNQTSPSWRAVASMAFPRRHLNALLLPDGKVLVTGGTTAPSFDVEGVGAVFAAELWDPATETWTTMASASVARTYHSATLLLPDGRVLSTGGNNHPETETYSPPYLFKGARPTITSAPSSIGYGQSFFIQTPNAATISKITLLRLSSTTHAFNMSQHISVLNFSQGAGGLNATAPPNANVAPPGHYMLFILNGSGVPSIAKIVQLGGAAAPSPPTVSITSPANGASFSAPANITINATATDSDGTVTKVEFFQGGTKLGEDLASPYSFGWNNVGAGNYSLTARATDNAGATTTSSAVSISVGGGGGGPTLAASPSVVAPGGSVTAQWSGIGAPTPTDWIGLYLPGAANTAYLAWIYVSCSQSAGAARAAGSCAFALPASLASGNYELRLLANNDFMRLATSNPLTVTTGAPPPPPPAGGLVGHWKLDEGAGTSAADASPNGLTGTLVGGPLWTTGRVGGALDFNGSSQYVDLSDPAALRITGAMTLALWVKHDTLNTGARLLAKQGGAGARSWSLNTEDTNPDVYSFQLYQDATAALVLNGPASAGPVTGVWTHVVAVFEPSVALRLYKDGVLIAQQTGGVPASQFVDNGLNINIGRRPDGILYTDGQIDEVRIYNRALSTTEIQQLFSGAAP